MKQHLWDDKTILFHVYLLEYREFCPVYLNEKWLGHEHILFLFLGNSFFKIRPQLGKGEAVFELQIAW